MYNPKTTGLSDVRGTHYDGQGYPSHVHYVRQSPTGGFGSIYKVRIVPTEKVSAGTTTCFRALPSFWTTPATTCPGTTTPRSSRACSAPSSRR